MQIERRRLDSLQLDPDNAREHDKANIDAIKASLEKFGQRKPIVVADGVVIAGNGTMEAAQALGWEEIDTVSADDLDETERRAYAIADNRTAELAKWNEAKLAEALSSVTEDGDAMGEATGFDHQAIVDLVEQHLAEPKEIVEDEVPEVQEETVTKPGDLWVLGDHRVLCGDSTNGDDVASLIHGAKPFVMVTDPPYGVKLDQSWRDKALGDKAMGPGNRNLVANDDRADWTEVWQMFPGDAAYVWHAGKFTDVVMASLRAAGFEICQQLIWNKSVMVMGRSDYHFKHEPCWYAVRKGKSHGWTGDRKQTTVIDAKSPNHIMSGSDEDKTEHPTQKPIECMAYLMKNHGGDVYDPFLGSGTTLIAAEQLGRKCYGMELNPAYCDVIVRRWQKLTGQRAVNEATGELFPE